EPRSPPAQDLSREPAGTLKASIRNSSPFNASGSILRGPLDMTFLSTKFRGRSMARRDRIALRRGLPSKSQHLFNRPLIIGMNAVLTGHDAAVNRDQEVGR